MKNDEGRKSKDEGSRAKEQNPNSSQIPKAERRGQAPNPNPSTSIHPAKFAGQVASHNPKGTFSHQSKIPNRHLRPATNHQSPRFYTGERQRRSQSYEVDFGDFEKMATFFNIRLMKTAYDARILQPRAICSLEGRRTLNPLGASSILAWPTQEAEML